ncbi:hypothetical protein [Chitinophaga sp. Cy-1792]|uniref:hypothetical protein n=1 Tax=Chitinophaga sp. Cy-1792 TaxID=2608339 RepID=UPI00141FE638|nr:hypothetical protein [Chitinophaga sp. Cy-1792]NIG52697.1 hypothetical protein [Chitinophaga sp. Cy-1792]
MKKLNSLIIMLLAVCVFYACRKNDNPKLPDGITEGVLPSLVQDTTGDVLIQNMSTFKTAFQVGLYFPNAEKPKKADLQVVMNNNYNNIKTFQADITTFPTNVSITGPQLATLFGLDVNNVPTNTSFKFGLDITTQDGKVTKQFQYGIGAKGDSVAINPYGADALTLPTTTGDQVIVVAITYTVVCPLVMSNYASTTGQTQYTLDDPDFWEDTYPVTLQRSASDSTKLTLSGYVQSPTAQFVIQANVKTQKASVAKQVYAAKLPGTSYTNPTVSGAGNFSACDTSIILSLTNTVDQGSFGTANITIKHN